MEWKNGELTTAELRNLSGTDQSVQVRYGAKTQTVRLAKTAGINLMKELFPE